MKKKNIRTLLIFMLVAILTLALVACGGGGNDDGGGGGNKPIDQIDFGKAGITGSFTAQVSGDLKTSRETENGVELKWEKSNEQSFNNVITWLKDGGYDKYDGAGADKESHPSGDYTLYCSDKTVSGVEYEATSIFFHKNTSISSVATLSATGALGAAPLAYAAPMAQEVNFKANDLYVIIEPIDDGGNNPGDNPGDNTYTSWPATQISQYLNGITLPAYSGTATNFTVTGSTLLHTVAITVNGCAENAQSVYGSTLTSNGYTGSGSYTKTTASETISVVLAYANPTGNSPTLTISATYTANSGGLISWPASQLSTTFPSVTIPAFPSTGTFGYTVIMEAGGYTAVSVVCYSATSANVTAYKTALENADFDRISTSNNGTYEKGIGGGKVVQIQIGNRINDSVTLTITTMSDAFETKYTLPENLKITFTHGAGESVTVIKVGNDYYSYIDTGYFGTVAFYLKYNGSMWTEYAKVGNGAWELSGRTAKTQRQLVQLLEGTSLVDTILYGTKFDIIFGGAYYSYLLEYSNSNALTSNKITGTDTVAGVNCDIYEDGNTVSGQYIAYRYYVEKTTGIVIKSGTVLNTSYTALFNTTLWQTASVTFDGLTLPA